MKRQSIKSVRAHLRAPAPLSRFSPVVIAIGLAWTTGAWAQAQDNSASATESVKDMGMVIVNSGRPSSLPSNIPTTTESITAQKIEQTVNASDSEDALKYFPSLLVRKRYIGDYNHAMLSSRASGTGNPARSAVYADGVLLSNYLGNSVSLVSFPPRWGMVTPEEIERVDVMYGPFSAAYPGNSVGAVVDYVTRMPTKFEAHIKTDYNEQRFDLYNTHETYRGTSTSASLGSKAGDWSWWLNLNRTDSMGQPLTFATRTLSSTACLPTDPIPCTPVTGGVRDKNNAGQDIVILGAGTQYHTVQDHIKTKLAYDFNGTTRLTYSLGYWQNKSEGRPVSYLRDAVGNPVYGGPVEIDGKKYTLTAGDFALTNESLTHYMHALSLKTNTKDKFDWEAAFSLYDYNKDEKRQNGTTLPGAATGGAGTVADGAGTGWNNLALRGTWRPDGMKGEHVVDFGFQQDSYKLQYLTSTISGNWITDPAGSQTSNVGGKTQLQSLYAQDAWRFAPQWKSVLGLRTEVWSANGGYTQITQTSPTPTNVNQSWSDRQEVYYSPKAAVSYQWSADTLLKASLGRAVRMPTVAELYGANATTNSQYINDPNLRPEKSWTTELNYEKAFAKAFWRVTGFAEVTQDALFSQGTLISGTSTTVNRVQNVGKIETQGIETALDAQDVGLNGLDLNASATYARSIIVDNDGFVVTAGDTIGKTQPNIPRWRATVLASYRLNPQWVGSVGARYSGPQYRTLNNADTNGYTYQGVSEFFVVDLRVLYKMDKAWTAAFGIDNVNNYTYWNFHPYPQRSYHASLKYDFK
jgi:iron complex outermembrane recepter protein